jgi:hypothetical protein
MGGRRPPAEGESHLGRRVRAAGERHVAAAPRVHRTSGRRSAWQCSPSGTTWQATPPARSLPRHRPPADEAAGWHDPLHRHHPGQQRRSGSHAGRRRDPAHDHQPSQRQRAGCPGQLPRRPQAGLTPGSDDRVQQVSFTFQQQDSCSPPGDGTSTWSLTYSQPGTTPPITVPATSTPGQAGSRPGTGCHDEDHWRHGGGHRS